MAMPSSNGNALQTTKQQSPTKKVTAVEYDSDIDPDDLLPVYLESKTELFHLQKPNSKQALQRSNSYKAPPNLKAGTPSTDPESAKLLRKIKRIEDDVLFDRYIANQQWEVKRIHLERDAAAQRSIVESAQENGDSQESETLVHSDDEVTKEAAKIGAALLEENGSDDEAALADLFASLPVNEVDPLTGKTSTVINGINGVKVTIRDFGKWTGMSPTRVLEEACRARLVFSSPTNESQLPKLTTHPRDSSVRLTYTLISDSSFSNRHSLRIVWSKAQDALISSPPPEIEYISSPKKQSFTMISVSAPDPKQSEAYIATTALFLIFGSSAREDKVFLRLPATWRELWTEFAESKKEKTDEADRTSIRIFRDMVREKRDQELEDGVLIQGAFRNRGSARVQDNSDESGPDKATRSTLNPEAYQRIWAEKNSTPSYQMMLVSHPKSN
jgi:ATP-dependent RNA helicase DHX29